MIAHLLNQGKTMTTTIKRIGFFFHSNSTVEPEKVWEVLSTFASNNFLITTENLEQLLERTIPENLLIFNEENFAFCRYSPDTWEVKKSIPHQG